MPEKTGAKTGGKWKPGQSGNPAGRPAGTRNKTTVAVEGLLAGEAEALTRKVVELAMGGDTTALRLCLERIAPPMKERPLGFDVPEIKGAEDLPAALGAVLGAVGNGDLTPSEAERIARVVASYTQALEVWDFDARLRALENARQG